jgi:hypothetical protein
VTFWTPERKAELQRCLDEGLTFEQAGTRIGMTKSACVGMASRCGIRPAASAPLSKAQLWSRKLIAPISGMIARLDALNPFPAPGSCVFPKGNPGAPDFHFCGDAVAIPQMPYCAVHAKVCFLSKAAAEQRSAAWHEARERKARERLAAATGVAA